MHAPRGEVEEEPGEVLLRGEKPVFTARKGCQENTLSCRGDWSRRAEVSERSCGVYIQANLSDIQGHLAVEWEVVTVHYSRKPGFKPRLERPLVGTL